MIRRIRLSVDGFTCAGTKKAVAYLTELQGKFKAVREIYPRAILPKDVDVFLAFDFPLKFGTEENLCAKDGDVTLHFGKRERTVRRTTTCHSFTIPKSGEVLTWNIAVFDYEYPFMDRGIVWVSDGELASAWFTLKLLEDGSPNKEQMEEIFNTVVRALRRELSACRGS